MAWVSYYFGSESEARKKYEGYFIRKKELVVLRPNIETEVAAPPYHLVSEREIPAYIKLNNKNLKSYHRNVRRKSSFRHIHPCAVTAFATFKRRKKRM